MQIIATRKKTFPFCCPVLWVSLTSLVSLAVALFILAPIYFLYYMNYISMGVVIWVTLGVFVAALFYDYLLLFLINRNDRNTRHENDVPNARNLNHNLF